MKTEIIVLTDVSGSMARLTRDVDGGYATFLADQKKVEGEARVTNVFFDTNYEVGPTVDLKDAVPFKHFARGGTALNDAVCRTLNEQGKRIAEEKWADLVIVLIITDGEENASKQYTRLQAKAMIEHAQGHGWKIIFQAANMDAQAVGSSYGIAKGMSQNFGANSVGTYAAYANTSAATQSLRGGAVGMSLAVNAEDILKQARAQAKPLVAPGAQPAVVPTEYKGTDWKFSNHDGGTVK